MNKSIDYYVGRVLRYLQYRDRSRGEVEQFLERILHKIEQSTEAKDQILARIEQFNLLNDSQFTDLVIQSRLAKGKGPRFIQQDLSRKGVDRHTIHKALASIPETDLINSARDVIRKKYTSLPSGQMELLKLKKYLLSRGYTMKTISTAIDLEGQKAVE